MKKFLLFSILLVLPATTWAATKNNPPIANLNTSIRPADVEQTALAAVDQNKNTSIITTTNQNTNLSPAETEQRRLENIAKLRDNPKILPLFLIPLAVCLFLLYRRISEHS